MNNRCNRFHSRTKDPDKPTRIVIMPQCEGCKYSGNCSIEMEFQDILKEEENESEKKI